MANISNTVSIYRDLLDCLFPRLCPGCDSILTTGERVFCLGCTYFFRKPAYPTKNQWKDIFSIPLAGIYVANHFHPGGRVQRVVHALKYRNRRDVAHAMGLILASKLPTEFSGTLVPVPQTKEGFRGRGYNQAELLARSIAMQNSLAVNPNLLERSGAYRSQTEKTREERISWIHNQLKAGIVEKGNMSGTVWLVDDVLTTGATLSACLDKLWSIGIRDLGIVVWAGA